MIVLALDTAGQCCYACLFDSLSGEPLSVAGDEIGRGHAERLMAFVDEALEGSGRSLADIDRIAVTVGPGSFTGIRIGVAAARGFALALGRPAVGVSTLHVLASSALAENPGRPVFAVMDAKRGELYCQPFDDTGRPAAPPALLTIAEAGARLDDFSGTVTGSGAVLLSAEDGGQPDRFDIVTVARLGSQADLAAGKPRPLYLRGADAKPQTGFALARA